jgi:hypothetical protein
MSRKSKSKPLVNPNIRGRSNVVKIQLGKQLNTKLLDELLDKLLKNYFDDQGLKNYKEKYQPVATGLEKQNKHTYILKVKTVDSRDMESQKPTRYETDDYVIPHLSNSQIKKIEELNEKDFEESVSFGGKTRKRKRRNKKTKKARTKRAR